MNNKYTEKFNNLLFSLVEQTKNLQSGKTIEIQVGTIFSAEDLKKIDNAFSNDFIVQMDTISAYETACEEMPFPYYLSWIKIIKK